MSVCSIMSIEDFDRTFHTRLADKCCANCKHGECEYEGGATCRNPKRNDGGYLYEKGEPSSKYFSYNTMQCDVCDLWEKEERGAE